MKFRFVLLLCCLLSFVTKAEDFKNRFSLGNPGHSKVFGVSFSLEYLRVFGEKHALYARTNQASHSSGADYSFGYRYYLSEKAIVDSWFVETGYKWARDASHTTTTTLFPYYSKTSYTTITKTEFARLVFGYQWVYFDRMNLDFGIGYEYDLKDNYERRFTGVLSLGIIF
ncbi:hypothetical protein [Halobacteriovorax sp. YZS-1-1]|uniref:hypothetical protein n=1 Tax=unclassified Halobacteriovorax TaxID=2639665 RepID=UPI003999B8A3